MYCQFLILSFFGIGAVALSILFYYLSKINFWLKKDNFRVVVSIYIILAIGHSLFMSFDTKSWLVFLGYFFGDCLVLIGLIPSFAAITRIAASIIAAPESIVAINISCPGASMKLMYL